MPEKEFTLLDYWRIIKKRKFIIGFSIISFLIFSWIFTSVQIPVYKAVAQIEVEKATPSLGGLGGLASLMGGGGGGELGDPVETETKIIKSRSIAEAVANKLRIIHENSSQTEIDKGIKRVQDGLSVERIGYSNILSIIVTSDDPNDSANRANTIAQVYVEKSSERMNKAKDAYKSALQQQLIQAEEKLKLAEEKLKDFTSKGIPIGTAGLSSKLSELKSELNASLKKYTSEHPNVVKLRNQINSIERQIELISEKEMELGRLIREVRLNEELYLLLSRKFKEAEVSEQEKVETSRILDVAQVPSIPVSPNKKMNLSFGLLLGLIIGSIVAFVLENLDTTIDTIEGIESFIELPVLGVIPLIFFEDEKERFKFLKRFFGYRTSKKDDESYFNSLVVLHKKDRTALESYHTLHTNISFILQSSKIKSILFTSAGPGEGKTITIANYALAAAQAGLKTILIESDLRQPVLHSIFGIQKENGFTDIIAGKINWKISLKNTTDFLMGKLSMDKILQTSGIENFKVLTSGLHTANPIDIISSENLKVFIKELKTEFDLILFDAPPLLLFADGIILARNVDGVVIVYRVGSTTKSALNRAKTQLNNIKANVIGVVLNGLKPSELQPTYGYYYSRYREGVRS